MQSHGVSKHYILEGVLIPYLSLGQRTFCRDMISSEGFGTKVPICGWFLGCVFLIACSPPEQPKETSLDGVYVNGDASFDAKDGLIHVQLLSGWDFIETTGNIIEMQSRAQLPGAPVPPAELTPALIELFDNDRTVEPAKGKLYSLRLTGNHKAEAFVRFDKRIGWIGFFPRALQAADAFLDVASDARSERSVELVGDERVYLGRDQRSVRMVFETSQEDPIDEIYLIVIDNDFAENSEIPCHIDSQCPQGYLCKNGLSCVGELVCGEDCLAGDVEAGTTCIEDESANSVCTWMECLTSDDCDLGLNCQNFFCQ